MSEDHPRAFFNYILFDKNFVVQDFGFEQVSEDAAIPDTDEENLRVSRPHERLSKEVPITKSGYIYLYVSNEDGWDMDVYFEDFKVTHIYGDVVAGSDYYPFGLAMEGREISREDYRFGYQGEFAEKDEETGWNHFELRQYDPVVGRWMSTDPARQYWSPYLGMGNNPVNMIDSDGAWSKFGAWWRNGFSMEGVYQAGDNRSWGFNAPTGRLEQVTYSIDGVEKNTWVEGYYFNVGKNNSGYSVPTLRAWEPSWRQQWGMSNNWVASMSYNMADAPYVTAQFFTPWRKSTHIDGQEVVGNEGADAFVNTASTALPYSRLGKIPKVTAPQFSSYFKGTFVARLQPKVRGWIIRTYNERVIVKTHGTVLSGTKILHKGTEFLKKTFSSEEK